MTPTDTSASESVWLASAARISLLRRLAARRSYRVTPTLTQRVPTMTTNDAGVTEAVKVPVARRPTAPEPTSNAANSSNTPMTRLAYVSNLAWPYGCPSSAGRAASAMPTSPTTLPAESNTEWMPSACMEADPLASP